MPITALVLSLALSSVEPASPPEVTRQAAPDAPAPPPRLVPSGATPDEGGLTLVTAAEAPVGPGASLASSLGAFLVGVTGLLAPAFAPIPPEVAYAGFFVTILGPSLGDLLNGDVPRAALESVGRLGMSLAFILGLAVAGVGFFGGSVVLLVVGAVAMLGASAGFLYLTVRSMWGALQAPERWAERENAERKGGPSAPARPITTHERRPLPAASVTLLALRF